MILILHLSTIERHSMYGLNMHIQKVASILNMQDLTIYERKTSKRQYKENTHDHEKNFVKVKT